MKVIQMIENNIITGVKYGIVEIPDVEIQNHSQDISAATHQYKTQQQRLKNFTARRNGKTK